MTRDPQCRHRRGGRQSSNKSHANRLTSHVVGESFVGEQTLGRRQVQSAADAFVALVTPSHLRSPHLRFCRRRPAVGHQTDARDLRIVANSSSVACDAAAPVDAESLAHLHARYSSSSRSLPQSVAAATFHRRRARRRLSALRTPFNGVVSIFDVHVQNGNDPLVS
jgi:hypothetical protein